MKKIALAFLLLVAALAPPVHAQQTFGLTPTFSKTLSVTTTTGNVQLGAGAGTTVVLWNSGTAAAYYAVGQASTQAATVAGSGYIPPGGCLVLNVQPSSYLAAITATGTTTLNATQGNGQTACSYGGVGAASGGGGGAATIADGADITQGAIADAAATAGSTGTLSAKLRFITTQLATLNTALGTPFQAGGSIGNTTFAVTNAGTFLIQMNATPMIGNGNGVVTAPSAEALAAITHSTSVTVAESCRVLKASAGNLYNVRVSIAATTGYVMVFDAASAPSDGAVTTLAIPAVRVVSDGTSGWYADDFTPPMRMATGITVCFSSTGPFSKTASATAAIAGQVQ